MFSITQVNENIPWAQACELIRLVGWSERSTDSMVRIFTKASHVAFVWYEDELIGFGRTTDDGCYFAMIDDVVVHPRYQRKGIGTRIVADLRDRLLDDGFLFVSLTAGKAQHAFYEKLGWKKQTTAFVWPRDTEQARKHTD